jgi:hypothetical protein
MFDLFLVFLFNEEEKKERKVNKGFLEFMVRSLFWTHALWVSFPTLYLVAKAIQHPLQHPHPHPHPHPHTHTHTQS